MHFFVILVVDLILLLVAIAFLTLAERKVLGAIQLRRGPSTVGVFGVAQPFADGLKLILKETVFPKTANSGLFIFASCLAFSLSLIVWVVIPFDEYAVLVDINFGVVFVLIISSLNVYSIVIAGWSSNSKYAFLGSVRAASQMLSYELTIGFILLTLLLTARSLNISDIVLAQKNIWFFVPYLPLCIIFSVCMLAETNRTPFDLPEAEAELVAGYNVEYSSIIFALFFLGEYSNMIFMSTFFVVLFFGGWLPFPFLSFFAIKGFWLGFKVVCVLFWFIWVRATFPRYRFDQLMSIGWKVFLPLTFAMFIFYWAFFNFYVL